MYEVSGTVTYKGESVSEGHIAFVPDGAAGQGGGGPVENGRYAVRVPAGKCKVLITASKKMPLPKGEVGMDGAKEEVRQYIPDKYNTNTELKADVPASGPVNFDLK